MIRRLHVSIVQPGAVALNDAEAHHTRDVLRLEAGTPVELFDDAGRTARGTIEQADAQGVIVRVDQVSAAPAALELIVASAVPKGDRADWMIEKLSELGVTRFIPLAAARSVVLPEGKNKRERWLRIATESAKQSRRIGVMRIDALTSVANFLTELQNVNSENENLSLSPRTLGEGRGEGQSPTQPSTLLKNPHPTLSLSTGRGGREESPNAEGFSLKSQRQTADLALYLSTEPAAAPLIDVLQSVIRKSDTLDAAHHRAAISLLIGPEGGWSPEEIALFARHNLTGVKLTATILRVETAAVAAAAMAAASCGV